MNFPQGINVFAPGEAVAERFERILGISSERARSLSSVMYGHEVAEAYYAQKMGAWGKKTRFGSHVSPMVVRSDIEMASRIGPETLQDYIKYRELELGYSKNKRYISGVRKILGEYKRQWKVDEGRLDLPRAAEDWDWWDKTRGEADATRRAAGASRKSAGGLGSAAKSLSKRKWQIGGVLAGVAGLLYLGSRFSGKDDNYKSIPGMPEYGLAAEQRRILTDFDSGYKGEGREKKDTRTLFSFFTKSLKKYGVETGTGHKRILIPKSVISKSDLTDTLGFLPVKIAVPEGGQSSSTSYRQLKGLHHIHEYDDSWTLHKDRHRSSTMLFEQWKREHSQEHKGSGVEGIGVFLSGTKHVVTEGIPGLFYYLKGKLAGNEALDVRLKKELPAEYMRQLSRLGGHDDKYNTIEGLRHGGKAEKKRHELTDFGSGWAGITGILITSVDDAAYYYARMRRISGKDDDYNVIQGLHEKGYAPLIRHAVTDFGSGYRRDKEKKGSLTSKAMVVGGGIGAAGAMYLTLYPWESSQIDLSRYPRLAAMRSVSKKYGFRTLSATGPESLDEALKISDSDLPKKLYVRSLFGELGMTRKASSLAGFKGVTYIQSGEWAGDQLPQNSKIVNLGEWDIGADKIDTWKYFQRKGVEDLHAPSIPAEEFYHRVEGKITKLSDQGKAFLEKTGGLENIVVKKRDAARGTGVWLNAKELPGDVKEAIFRNPREYLFQQKMDLEEEFRVVTVGDFPVSTTYRFGSPELKKLAKTLGYTPTKEQIEKTARISPFEVIQPVLKKEYRSGLEAFAEKVARELPYEIGALDIGLTKDGKFTLIEAQRSFGNISNPITSRRIKQVVTGKMGVGAIIATALTGVAVAGIIHHYTKPDTFPKENSAFNPIDGLSEGKEAKKMRHKMTPHGSKIDRFKLALQSMGKLWNKVFESKGLLKTMRGGTFIKNLGEGGGFGSAALYKAKYAGHEFEYVKKTFFANPVMGRQGVRKSLEEEVSTMRAIGGVEGAPSLYGHTTDKNSWLGRLFGRKTENAIYMEHIPGQELAQRLGSGQMNITESQREMLHKTVTAMAEKGYLHTDLNPRNILISGESEAFIIDYGLVSQVPISERARAALAMRNTLDSTSGLRVKRAAAKLTESTRDLRMTQEAVWDAANNGGKGHTKYAGSHVKQLSKFGGNI
jgi:predicted Ser/Thr protein kinase